MRARTQIGIIVFLVVLGHVLRINSPVMILPLFLFPPFMLYLQALPYILPFLAVWTLLLIGRHLWRTWRTKGQRPTSPRSWVSTIAAAALGLAILYPYGVHLVYPTYQTTVHAPIGTPTTVVFENSFDYGTCRSFCFMLEDFGVDTIVFSTYRGLEYTWSIRNDVCVDGAKAPMDCWAPRDRLTEAERAQAYIVRIANPEKRTNLHDRITQDLTVERNGNTLVTVTNTESDIPEFLFGQTPHAWRVLRGMDFMGVQEDKTIGYIRKVRDDPQRPYTSNFFAFENQGLSYYTLRTLGLFDPRSEGYGTPGNIAFRKEMDARLSAPRMTYERFVGLLGELDFDGTTNLLNMYASEAGEQSHQMRFDSNKEVCIKNWVESQTWYDAEFLNFYLEPDDFKAKNPSCKEPIGVVYTPEKTAVFARRSQEAYQTYLQRKQDAEAAEALRP